MKIARVAIITLAALIFSQSVFAKGEASKDMAKTIKDSKKFSYLSDSLRRVGMMKTLHGPGPYTFFVPKNNAFDDMPYGKWVGLWNDKPMMKKVLSRGLVKGRYNEAELSGGTILHTVDGGIIKLENRDKDLWIGDEKLKETDIQCTNGVIHIVDGFIGREADKKGR